MGSTKYITVLEDEKISSDKLRGYLFRFAKERQADLNVSCFYDAQSFFEINHVQFDIIFLDIELPDGNGMQIAKKLREDGNNSIIIFVTNLAKYAIRGYDVGAFDFIVKPINYSSFVLKFERAYSVAERNKKAVISVEAGKELKILEVSKIKYIEVCDHYVYLHTVEGVIKTFGKLADFHNRLKGLSFALCNQCFLVNMKYISGIKDDCVLLGDEQLRISRPRKKEFLKTFNDYLGV